MKIYLIGMPFSGKTIVGEKLAKKLNFNHVDTDLLIEKQENLKINEIFSLHGEKYFRKLEKNYLKKLIIHNNCIISTGGGMVLDRENKFLMEGLIIYLNTSIEILNKRSENSFDRPILLNKTMEELYQERRKYYYFFNTFVIDGNNDVDIVVDEIIKLLKKEDLL